MLDDKGYELQPGDEVVILMGHEGRISYPVEHWRLQGKYLGFEPMVDYVHLELDGEERTVYVVHIGNIRRVVTVHLPA